jgi:integrase
MKTGRKAWIGQRKKDVAQLGESAAPWIVFWNEPNGKRKEQNMGPGSDGKKRAKKRADKLHAQLIEGTYDETKATDWSSFRAEYESHVGGRLAPRSKESIVKTMSHFERIAKPGKVSSITTKTIDLFVAARCEEDGRKGGDKVSPATVNQDLRNLKAMLRKAAKWGYLKTVPDIEFVREPGRIARFVSSEHFAAMFNACDAAELPVGQSYSAKDWWQSLLAFAYLTGWRIRECLALRREDLNIETGRALTRAADNKGNRDDSVKLAPALVTQLEKIKGFDTKVFPWPKNERALWTEFAKIQQAAGIRLPCQGDHDHTDACHLYGFHDLRRAFATMNAPKLSADALQKLMRHKSYATTQRYINMASQLDQAAETIYVPDVLKAIGG